MAGVEWVAPSTEDEALRYFSSDPPSAVVPIAGGTDLLLDLEAGRVGPRRLVSLSRLPWRELEWAPNALRIGSTRPLADIQADPRVRQAVPGLIEAILAVGGPALRHRATLGGNLARAAPASDVIPLLLAVGASVELVGADGHRTVPVDQFVRASRETALRPGELIRRIVLPVPRPSAYRWHRVRPVNDISHVAVGGSFDPGTSEWTVAIGGVPPRPQVERDRTLGARPSDAAIETFARAVAERVPLRGDLRASEGYRRRVVAILVARTIRAVAMADQIGSDRGSAA